MMNVMLENLEESILLLKDQSVQFSNEKFKTEFKNLLIPEEEIDQSSVPTSNRKKCIK